MSTVPDDLADAPAGARAPAVVPVDVDSRALVSIDPIAARAAFTAAADAVVAAFKSKHTRIAYAADLAAWLRFCDRHTLDPSRPQLAATAAFRDEELTRLAAPSVARRLGALAGIYTRLRRGGVVTANPFSRDWLDWPSSDSITPTPAIPREAAEAMFTVCRDDPDRRAGTRDFALLQLLWWTGARRMSIAPINVEDLHDEGGLVYARLVRKGATRYDVPLAPEAIMAIRTWQEAGGPTQGPLFVRADGTPFVPDDISVVVAARARQAGIVPLPSPHQFRAAMITAALDRGSLRDVQALAGHARPETTVRYDRKERERAASAVEALVAQRDEKPSSVIEMPIDRRDE